MKSDTSRAAKDIEKKIESTVKVASGTAQKVKNNATQAVKDAEKKVEDTVQTATAAAQKVNLSKSNTGPYQEQSIAKLLFFNNRQRIRLPRQPKTFTNEPSLQWTLHSTLP